MSAPPLKPGDLVRTPSGRTAVIDELRPDGRRDLRYVDQDRGTGVLRLEQLTLVARAPLVPWTKRTVRW